MKLKRVYLEYGGFLLVYLFALLFWSAPYQEIKSPYGEWDAISHFGLAQHYFNVDGSYQQLPEHMHYRYGNDNLYKPLTLWYHPPFHLDMAIASALASEPVVPIFLTNTIFATAILFSVFFVIRSLFGFLPAIISSFMLTFSGRDIMPYIFGQWPERFGYAFLPVILYCYYKYHESSMNNAPKVIYLYLLAGLLGANVFIHPLGFFHALVGLGVLAVFLFFKDKKLIALPVKHIVLSALLFVLLFVSFPNQSGNTIVQFTTGGSSGENEQSGFSRLFSWSFDPAQFAGSVPPSYFSFSDMHGGWTLPFLLLGIGVLALRRERRDLFLLAWLVAMYIILHRDIFGITNFLHRSLSASAHIFIPLTVIGALSIPRFLPVAKSHKKILTGVIAVVLVGLTIGYNFPPAKAQLENAYTHPLSRMNQHQIEISTWIAENVDGNKEFAFIGSPHATVKNVVWMAYYANQDFAHYDILTEPVEEGLLENLPTTNIIVDYSEIAMMGDPNIIQHVQAFEQTMLVNHTLIHQTEFVRIYKHEGADI